MIRSPAGCALALLFAAAAFAAGPRRGAAQGGVAPEVRDRLLAATVFIETRLAISNRDWQNLPEEIRTRGLRESVEGSGTGFVVSPDGTVVTNAHVLDSITYEFRPSPSGVATRQVPSTGRTSPFDPKNPTRPFQIRFTVNSVKVVVKSGSPDEREVSPKILRIERGADLAILKLPGEGYDWLEADYDAELHPGDRALMAGFPGGKLPDVAPFAGSGDLGALMAKNPAPSLNAGLVSAIRRHQGRRVIQLDIRANHGNSGGPIATPDGRVVGVLYAGIDSLQSVNYAIPIEYVRPYLRASGGDGGASAGDESPGGGQSFRDFLDSGSFEFGGKP